MVPLPFSSWNALTRGVAMKRFLLGGAFYGFPSVRQPVFVLSLHEKGSACVSLSWGSSRTGIFSTPITRVTVRLCSYFGFPKWNLNPVEAHKTRTKISFERAMSSPARPRDRVALSDIKMREALPLQQYREKVAPPRRNAACFFHS